MVFPYSVFLVLGAAATAGAVAQNSHSPSSEYGSPVLLSGVWPALCLEFTHLGHISSGTSAQRLLDVFVENTSENKKTIRKINK
jgi:hypothetical protein